MCFLKKKLYSSYFHAELRDECSLFIDHGVQGSRKLNVVYFLPLKSSSHIDVSLEL